MGGILCLLALGVSLYLWNRRRLKYNSAKEQAASDKLQQLYIAHEELQQQYKKLLSGSTAINEKQEKPGAVASRALQEMIASSIPHSEGYWNEFMLQFSGVYPDFFKNLKISFPDLTQHELRICAMIKLNLSLQDIAHALNITSDSARKAKYRIYKKMRLHNDQEFVDRILQT